MAWSLVETPAEAPCRCERVYMDFFGLNGIPFSITPDPEFLFLSETHRSVIEKIYYGIQSRMGFMLLTGEIGTGKTTLCRVLLDQLQNHARTVYVINPSLSGRELLEGILDDLGVVRQESASKKELIDHLNRFLLRQDETCPVFIIIDDAQTMPAATLEDLRLLSNLETDKRKLLQILLVGQPELLTQLDRPELRQLKQRITVNGFLDFLSREEVHGYIEQRLFIAGNQGQIRFSPKTMGLIHRRSGGVPRLINKICDMALTAAYTTGSHIVGTGHLRTACRELIESRSARARGPRPWQRRRFWWWLALGLALGALICFGLPRPSAAGIHACIGKASSASGMTGMMPCGNLSCPMPGEAL
jgi:general secretion pathway protein A